MFCWLKKFILSKTRVSSIFGLFPPFLQETHPMKNKPRKQVLFADYMHETLYFKAFRDVLPLKKYAVGQCPSEKKKAPQNSPTHTHTKTHTHTHKQTNGEKKGKKRATEIGTKKRAPKKDAKKKGTKRRARKGQKKPKTPKTAPQDFFASTDNFPCPITHENSRIRGNYTRKLSGNYFFSEGRLHAHLLHKKWSGNCLRNRSGMHGK